MILASQGAAAATGGDGGSLAAQRRALQQQAQGVLGARGTTVAQLLQAQDRLGDLRRQLDRNSAWLADLERRQGELATSIVGTQERVRLKRASLANLTRQQYKTQTDASMSQIFFGSASLGQVVDRMVATQAVSSRTHAAILDLEAAEVALADQSATLRQEQDARIHVQEQLTALHSEVLSQAADYQARVSALDASSTALLARIASLDAAIAAENRPPSGVTPSQQAVIQIIRSAAAQYGANGDQMVRVANCESGLNPHAYDAASGASGLFQFMPGTFYGNGGHDIWDATDQSNVAAKMFAQGQAGAWACR